MTTATQLLRGIETMPDEDDRIWTLSIPLCGQDNHSGKQLHQFWRRFTTEFHGLKTRN